MGADGPLGELVGSGRTGRGPCWVLQGAVGPGKESAGVVEAKGTAAVTC